MAQLPDESSNNSNENKFECSSCRNTHDISDVFLWSACHHKYGRGCVVFDIRQQMYDKRLPACVVHDCKKLLLQDEAQLVLQYDILLQYYNLHNEHPQTLLDHDEKNSQHQYQSLHLSNDADSSSGGIANTQTQILGTIDNDPLDDSSEAEISYHCPKNEQQPFLNTGAYGGYIASNMDNKRNMLFDCVLCNEKHIAEERFEWTQCKHLYGRQCAENMIISWLFKQDIAQCVECKKRLNVMDAMTLLPYDELQMFKEYYAIKASMDIYNTDQHKENTKDSHHHNNNSAHVSDQIQSAATDDASEKVCVKHEAKEMHDDDNKLMPSILVLPDNNFSALIPMDGDFVDGNEMVLNEKKQVELKKNNLFYCSVCKEVLQIDDDRNGKFISLKCEHVTCKTCAKQHSKHCIEILQCIASCPVCPESITDLDMIAIWGENDAKALIDKLFDEKSLKIPPYKAEDAAVAVAIESNTLTTAGVTKEEVVDDDDVVNEKAIIEEKEKKEEKEDEWHCLTEYCHKKGSLSTEINEETRLDCAHCGVSWCVRCCDEWHLGQTCEQYQGDINIGVDKNDDMSIYLALKEQEEMTFDDNYNDIFNYEEHGCKACPVCFTVVDKDGGCNHITCKCGAKFCWICSNLVDDNNFAMHYSDGKCSLNEDC